MTSALSKEDIEDALYKAGIRSPVMLQYLMRKIEVYARKYPAPEYDPFLPAADPGDHGYRYKCRACGERKYLSGFPERKRQDRRSAVPCSACEEKALTSASGHGRLD